MSELTFNTIRKIALEFPDLEESTMYGSPALLSDEPKTYYITDHYANHPVVLVSLARMQQDQLCDLIPAARHCVLAHGGKQQKAGRHFSTGPQVP